jgi:hypothetical protein
MILKLKTMDKLQKLKFQVLVRGELYSNEVEPKPHYPTEVRHHQPSRRKSIVSVAQNLIFIE